MKYIYLEAESFDAMDAFTWGYGSIRNERGYVLILSSITDALGNSTFFKHLSHKLAQILRGMCFVSPFKASSMNLHNLLSQFGAVIGFDLWFFTWWKRELIAEKRVLNYCMGRKRFRGMNVLPWFSSLKELIIHWMGLQFIWGVGIHKAGLELSILASNELGMFDKKG